MSIRNYGELGIILQKIMTRLLNNQTLLKLLYYEDKDPKGQIDLSVELINKEVVEKLIKIIPRVGPKEDAKSVVALRVVSAHSDHNNQFKNITLGVEVFVPLTQWMIKDSNLRPFAILGEIQESLDGKVVNGFKITGGDFDLSFLTEEMACYEQTFVFTEYE